MTDPKEPQSDGLIRKEMTFELLSLDEEGRSLRMIASTPARDSYGDVVNQYWDLSHFDKNPAVLFGHNRAPGGLFGGSMDPEKTIPVGYSKAHAVVNGQLQFEPVFSDDRANPIAERVWQGIRQKVLRAASVGFRPGKIIREETDAGVETYYVGTADQPNVLKEISIVPIGANHEAVGLAGDNSGPQIAELWALQETRDKAPEAPGDGMAHNQVQLSDTSNPSQVLPGVIEVQTPVPDPAPAGPSVDVKALEDRAATAERELEDSRAKLKQYESEKAKADVRELIGQKITPAQEADFLALRELAPELFVKITDGLPALRLTEDVTGQTPITETVKQDPNETADARAARKLRA